MEETTNGKRIQGNLCQIKLSFMNILERVKLGCMDIDTQFKETDTVEEFDSNDGYKCTKKNISEKGSSAFKKYY